MDPPSTTTSTTTTTMHNGAVRSPAESPTPSSVKSVRPPSEEQSLAYVRNKNGDFPDGLVAEILHAQCRGPRFGPRSENKTPNAAVKILDATTKTRHSQINNYYLKKRKRNKNSTNMAHGSTILEQNPI